MLDAQKSLTENCRKFQFVFTAICGRMQSLRAYIQRIDMTDIISQLQFSATITGPICLMLGLGVLLNGLTWSMRILLKSRRGLFFRSLFQRCCFEHRQFKARFFLKHFLSGIQLNCQYAVFLFTLFSTRKLIDRPHDWGVITQGGFRATPRLLDWLMLPTLMARGSPLRLSTSPRPRFCSTFRRWLLSHHAEKVMVGKRENWCLKHSPKTVNHLDCAWFLCYLASVPIPKIVTDAGHYFANMTLPLALLCTGGSLNLNSLKDDRHSAWFATGYKLILSPLLITGGAWLLGFRGLDLGLLFWWPPRPPRQPVMWWQEPWVEMRHWLPILSPWPPCFHSLPVRLVFSCFLVLGWSNHHRWALDRKLAISFFDSKKGDGNQKNDHLINVMSAFSFCRVSLCLIIRKSPALNLGEWSPCWPLLLCIANYLPLIGSSVMNRW